jgi:phytoene synthase
VNPDLASSYAYCQRLARQHYENFPVASFLLPRAARPHIAAVYAFARVADDIADEGDRPADERLAELDQWSARLLAAAFGKPPGPEVHAEVFVALANTIRVCRLPVPLLQDLLKAFRQDLTVTRYATWADVLDYCRRSANPVGRLVLRIAGYDDSAMDVKSDAICSALQITNFLQDLAVDWTRGRLYMPRDIWERAGARESDLDTGRLTPEWRTALTEVASRVRTLFEAGRDVCDEVDGRLRFELRATWLGGVRILDRLATAGYDVFAARPALGVSDAAGIAWRVLRWTSVASAKQDRLGPPTHDRR